MLPAKNDRTYYHYDAATKRFLEIDAETGMIVACSQTADNGLIQSNMLKATFTPFADNSWKYSTIYRDYICQLIVEGNNLATIGRTPGMPPAIIIGRWRRENADFREYYNEAVRLRAEIAAEELIDTSAVADMDREEMLREKLRDDKRKFHAEKFNPEKFGKAESTGGGANITMVINTGVPSAIDTGGVVIEGEVCGRKK